VFSRLEDFRFARWARSLNRSVQILFSLSLVAALNILAATHFERWDLTANHRFSLSPETLAYLSTIPHDSTKTVEISLILPENQSDENNRVELEQIRALLNEYAYEAPRLKGGPVPLKIEEIDQLRQSGKLDALKPLGWTPLIRIMVVRDGRGHAISMADLYDTKDVKSVAGDSMGQAATAFKGENAVTSAILDVIQTKADPILFTVGHGEMLLEDHDQISGLSNLADFLSVRNYNLGEIDLAKDNKTLDDAKLVVVASPRVPFQPYEVEKLRHYLNDKNGRVMIFLEPGDNHGLAGLLTEWGLRSHDWRVFDPQNSTSDEQMAINPRESSRPSELTRSLALSNLSVVVGATRPVEVDENAPADDRRQIQEVLATSRTSFAEETDDYLNNVHNPVIFPGPFVVAALSERRATDAVDLPGGRLLVFGDAEFIANQNFKNYGNPYLILNSVNYLANRENMLNIPPKAPHQNELGITREQFAGLAWRLAVVPAVVAMLGMVVFWVRHRT
jgi:hypothetical protein